MKIRISLIFPLLFIFYFVSGQPAEIIYQGNLVKAGFDNDVAYGPFNIGFNFTYYGSSWSQFYISSNGLVTFGEGSNDPSEDPIPTAGTPENMIAAFWDDLSIDPSGNILYTTVGAAPNRKLIIQFRNMGFYYGPVYLGTFSVILYETTNRIQTQYRLLVLPTSTAVHGGSATFGIENSDGTEGVQYAYHNSSAVTSGQAISYTPSGSTYTLDPDAVYDGVYLTTNLTLPEPGIATLVSPADGAIIGSAHTFQWSESSNAGSYTLKVSRFANLSGATNYSAGSGTSYTVSGLTVGITYYWGVFATNATGTTWSEIKRFTTSDFPPLVAVPQVVWVEQGEEKITKLNFTGGDASAKTARVTSLPAQGELYQVSSGVKGARITTVPAIVTDPGFNLIFLANGTSGNGVGNFNFYFSDNTSNSPVAMATINISPAGVPNVLYVAKSSDRAEIQFDIPMADPSGKENQFMVNVDLTSVEISSANLKTGDPYTIELVLASTLTGGEDVVVSYFQGDVLASTGGYLFSFYDYTASLISQSINFDQSLDRKYNESPLTLTAISGSGLGITYSSSNLSVATTAGSVMTFHSLGQSTITARQAGNSAYAPARYVKTLTVAIGDQTITFNAITATTIGDADFSPGATASSGLPVSYSSSNTAVATIISNLIHIVGAGTSQITASQVGNTYFNSAAPLIQTLVVTDLVTKTLSLSSVFLQGLYIGGGAMRQSYDEMGPHWPGSIADQINIELHDQYNYSGVIYTASNVSLNINGTATISIPSEFNGSYYVTIRHRNHIATTTASAVSFSGSNIIQSFGSQANVFGGNLSLLSDGRYVIFGGDIDQDGFVGVSDMTLIENQSVQFGFGYIVEDADGDGFVGVSDMVIIENNSILFVFSITP